MTILLADAEWSPTGIHCVVIKDYSTKEVWEILSTSAFTRFAAKHPNAIWVFHNGLTADIPTINKYAGTEVLKKEQCIDTFVVSRLVNYQKFNTHSLKELGEYLGVYKGDYTGGFDTFSTEMLEYCVQDVEVLEAIFDMYKKYIMDPKWKDAMRTEHDLAWLCGVMKENGFTFNKEKAEGILEEITKEMSELEDSFKTHFPPKLVEDRRLKLKYTKDGKMYKKTAEAIASAPHCEITEDEVILYEHKEFNPGSPVDRIDVLWDAGWKPFVKTKGHLKAEREARWKRKS